MIQKEPRQGARKTSQVRLRGVQVARGRRRGAEEEAGSGCGRPRRARTGGHKILLLWRWIMPSSANPHEHLQQLETLRMRMVGEDIRCLPFSCSSGVFAPICSSQCFGTVFKMPCCCFLSQDASEVRFYYIILLTHHSDVLLKTFCDLVYKQRLGRHAI